MTRPRWPSDFFFEISEEAARKTLNEEILTLQDIRPLRRFPPSCKKNGVLIKDASGKVAFAGDLYFDEWTGYWLLALQPDQYRRLKRIVHGPHDTLGALVL